MARDIQNAPQSVTIPAVSAGVLHGVTIPVVATGAPTLRATAYIMSCEGKEGTKDNVGGESGIPTGLGVDRRAWG